MSSTYLFLVTNLLTRIGLLALQKNKQANILHIISKITRQIQQFTTSELTTYDLGSCSLAPAMMSKQIDKSA